MVIKVIVTSNFLLSIAITLGSASKCPESRKPHPTSCKIFYNCVNLPDGGYVWVPSKCANGLIFQPYLLMCVLPGDTWTCDNFATESPFITYKYEEPDLIDASQTSYVGYTEDPLNYSETVDSSYPTNDTSDESYELLGTSYPLILIDEPTTENNIINDAETDTPPLISSVKESILYNFFSRLSPNRVIQDNKVDFANDYYAWRKRIIAQVIYRNISIFAEEIQPILTVTSNTSNNHKTTGYFSFKQNNTLLNYFLNNHNQEDQNNDSTTTLISSNQSKTEGDIASDKHKETTVTNAENSNNNFQVLNDNVNEFNNIIMVNDKNGSKLYLTLERYRFAVNQLKGQSVKIIPCTKNTRLPNDTDCTKYYTCDPASALIRDYKCPLRTAFNNFTRLCDMQSYTICLASNEKQNVQIQEVQTSFSANKNLAISLFEDKKCNGIGKTEDPTSDNHYYICYYSNNPADSAKPTRMVCPNGLIFCANKKICTTKQLCTT